MHNISQDHTGKEKESKDNLVSNPYVRLLMGHPVPVYCYQVIVHHQTGRRLEAWPCPCAQITADDVIVVVAAVAAVAAAVVDAVVVVVDARPTEESC